MTEHRVPESVGAMPLPRYLARAWPLLPGWALRQAVKKRDIRLNGLRWDGAAPVRGGDILALFLPDKYLTGPLEVLYRDENFLGVVKPPALPMDADAQGIGADTLLERARRIEPGARLCHRLDAGTGGAMLLALNDRAQARLDAAFRAHQVRKTYQAVVLGAPSSHGELTHYLVKDAAAARVRALDRPAPQAQQARLRYAVLAYGDQRALVQIQLLTGRTHQIRVQMAKIGHPLLGDDKYGDRAFNKRWKAKEPLLWCVALEWENIALNAPAPFGWKEEN